MDTEPGVGTEQVAVARCRTPAQRSCPVPGLYRGRTQLERFRADCTLALADRLPGCPGELVLGRVGRGAIGGRGSSRVAARGVCWWLSGGVEVVFRLGRHCTPDCRRGASSGRCVAGQGRMCGCRAGLQCCERRSGPALAPAARRRRDGRRRSGEIHFAQPLGRVVRGRCVHIRGRKPAVASSLERAGRAAACAERNRHCRS